jgi:hypothetical protein
VTSRRCNVADEDRAEQGIPLENMETSGMRNRLGSSQASASANASPESPSTASGESGTLTPGSEDNSENQAGEHSFVKATWRRLSNGFGTGLFGMSAEEQEKLNQKRGYHNFIQEKIDEYPEGFPRLSAFVNSDDDFAMCRSFKLCHIRLLLHLQVEITIMEKELFELDKKDEANPAMEYRRRTTKHKEHWDSEQRELRKELTAKIMEYDELVRKHVFMQSLGPPPERNHRSYFNWIWKRKPLGTGYYDYIYHASDFVKTSGTKSNYFEDLIRDHMAWWRGSPIRTFMKIKEEVKPTSDTSITFYSPLLLRRLGQLLLVSTLMGVLLIPVFLLFLVPMSRLNMAVTSSSFIFLFILIMSIIAEGRIYEIFVGTATYAAILIMFLGNISSASAGGGPN